MNQYPSSLEKITKFLSNPITLTPNEIFTRFIHESVDDLFLTRSDNKFVCGGHIEQYTLSFQCYTCAPDPHHMFCQNCFKPEKHQKQDHKCMMRHNIGGCCDCGDEKTITKSAFCESHQGFGGSDVEKVIEQINPDLQSRLKHFIHIVVAYMVMLVDQCKAYEAQTSNMIEEIVRVSNQFKINELPELFANEQATQEVELSKKLKQSIEIYNMFFGFIRFTTQGNMPYLLLISNTFMEVTPLAVIEELMKDEDLQNTNRSIAKERDGAIWNLKAQTMFENLVRYSTYFEHGNLKSDQNDDIYFSFHTNDRFKWYMQETYLKLNQYYYRRVRSTSKNIKDHIEKFKQIAEYYDIDAVFSSADLQNLVQSFKSVVKEWSKDYKQMNSYVYLKSELHEHHTQFVSEEFQTKFFLSPHIDKLYDNYQKYHIEMYQLFNIVSTMVSLESYMHFSISQNVLRLRFEYDFFPKIQNKLLQQILGDQMFLKFNNQKIHCDQLPIKYYEEFSIIRLIRIIAQQPQMIQEVIKSPDQLSYYQYNQTQSIKLITEAFKKLIQEGSWFYNDNLTQSCLYASFMSVYRRNKLSHPIIFQALANSQLSDRLFGFFLAYIYFWMNSPNRYDFKIFLQNVLKNNYMELMNTILPVVIRAVESYCDGMIDINSQNYFIYIGQNIPEMASLMSNDLCLIRMGLFIFQNEALNQIVKVFAKKQHQNYEHLLLKMIMSIVLTDHDLLNVVGPQFSELPKDLKFYFRKLMYGLYLIKNYYSFNDLVINLKQTGLISLLQYQKIIHEVCQLDPILRELKLKPQHQHKNIYEPIIFIDSARLKGKIHEKLIENKDSPLDLLFGNSLEYDLLTFGNEDTATMGNMRKSIVEDLANNDLIIQHISISQDIHQQNMLIRLIDFHKLSLNHFGISSESFEYKMQTICKQIQQLRDPRHIQPKQDSIISKILNWFITGKKEEIEEQIDPQENHELVSTILKDKQVNQMAIMKKRFQQKQAKFNNKFVLDQKEAQLDEEFELCQGCKLNLIHESNSICSPALIQFSNINRYIMNDKDVNLVLTSCKHLFHKECLDERVKAIKKSQLPIWFNLCCPLCKFATNIVIPISKKMTNLLVQEFANQFISMVNTNMNMVLYFFDSSNVTVEQIFLRGMALILDNLVWQMLFQTQQFIAKKQTIIIENLCRLIQIYLQMHPQPNELNNPEPTTVIERVKYVIKKWVFGGYSREDTRTSLKAIPLDIDFALFEHLMGEQSDTVVVVSQTDTIRQILRERIIKNIGLTFETMYNKYFLRACSYCSFYPTEYQSDEVAELFICLLCYSVMCKGQCIGSEKYDGEHFSNLNHHALEHHYDSTLYLSITTGQVVIVCAPFSIQGYKYLYYDKLGQKIQIQDSTLDWSSYYLDERVLNDLVELIVSYNLKSVPRAALDLRVGIFDATGRL